MKSIIAFALVALMSTTAMATNYHKPMPRPKIVVIDKTKTIYRNTTIDKTKTINRVVDNSSHTTTIERHYMDTDARDAALAALTTPPLPGTSTGAFAITSGFAGDAAALGINGVVSNGNLSLFGGVATGGETVGRIGVGISW